MTSQIRPDLDLIPAYVPGRSAPGAVKLASNETTMGPLPSVVDAMTEAGREANRYPDITSSALVGALTEFLAVDHPTITGANVTAGCGSVALCQQLVQAVCRPGDEVVFGWRSFEAYPILTRIAHATPVQVPVLADGRLDLEGMLGTITERTRLVFVCSPNNPTGPAVSQAELEAFVDAVPPHVTVAVDEAYFEFTRGTDTGAVADGITLALSRPNVVSLRTFSKAYGLAGLRIGYLVGPSELVEAAFKMIIPFSVSTVAKSAAIASLHAADELRTRTDSVVAERDRVLAELRELGYRIPDSQSNFLWLPINDDAPDFDAHCLEYRVVVRTFPGFGVRVTIGDPAENDLFLGAAAAWEGTR